MAVAVAIAVAVVVVHVVNKVLQLRRKNSRGDLQLTSADITENWKCKTVVVVMMMKKHGHSAREDERDGFEMSEKDRKRGGGEMRD